jgi:hypothetical protein
MLDLAINRGGRKLDAFDTVLPHIYGRSGFDVAARRPWNDEYTPEGWDHKSFSQYNGGKPDVVFMAYNPNKSNFYHSNEGDHAPDDDQALNMQQAAVKRGQKRIDKLAALPAVQKSTGGIVDHALRLVSHLTRR